MIDRPDGDNEGDPLNGPTIYPYLSTVQQEHVDTAEDLCCKYTRRLGGEIDRRALGHLVRKGFHTQLGPAQYEADRLVGGIDFGEMTLDISDSGPLLEEH
jgi:hypothetical protein